MQDTPAITNAIIRDSVNIFDIIRASGGTPERARQGKHKTKCPRCRSDCLVTALYYRCSKCGSKGNVIDFYSAVNNIDDWNIAKNKLISDHAPKAAAHTADYTGAWEARKKRIAEEPQDIRTKAIQAVSQLQNASNDQDARELKSISEDAETYTTDELLALVELYGGERGKACADQINTNNKLDDIVQQLRIRKPSELTEAERKPPEALIDNLLPIGLTILCAPPKTGKSFLALQIFDAITNGKPFWGRSVKQCDAIYLCLESSDSEMYERCTAMGIPTEFHGASGYTDQFAGITLSTEITAVDVLRKIKHLYPSVRLFIVDTITHWVSDKKNKNNAYLDESALLAPLQRMAIDEQIAVLAIAHTNKSGVNRSSDPLDRINGSTAFGGSAQSIIVIDAPTGRTDSTAKIHCIHRRFPCEDLSVRRDPHSFKWEIDDRSSQVKSNILDWCIQNAGAGAEGNFYTYSEVCRLALGIEPDPASAARKVKDSIDRPMQSELFSRDVFVSFGRTSNGHRGIRLYKTNTKQEGEQK